MSPKYPNIEVRVNPGTGIGQHMNPYWTSFFAGQVFGELHRIDAPDRNEYLRDAMRLDREAILPWTAEWVTVIDEKGFKVTA